MLQIWICDDERVLAEDLAGTIKKGLETLGVQAQLRLFSSGSELISALDTQNPDLAFLDLVLQETDGYSIAEELRRRRIGTELVFVTAYPQYMSQAFAYRPIGFATKPVDRQEMEELLHRFITFYWNQDAVYSFHTREQDYAIGLKDILYFESSGHKVLIHTAGQDAPIAQHQRLDDVQTQLQDKAFIRCHKSYLVSLAAIVKLDRSRMRALLRSGDELPISRGCFSRVMDCFINYRLR